MMNPKDNDEHMKQVIMDNYGLTSVEFDYIADVFHELTLAGLNGSFYDLLEVVKILKPNLENLGVGINK